MRDATALEQLAERHGIAAAYSDIRGRTRRAKPAVLEWLLTALRVDERAPGGPEILPAAVVVRADRQPLRFRVALEGARLTWHLEEESGADYRGALTAGELTIRREVPCGYHRLTLFRGSDALATCALIVTPAACFTPPALANGARIWGAAAQLYALRSSRNWGIGDFTDLALLVSAWGARGADLVGVNPLHALFPHRPAHASPYSPSSRLFLNVLYLDVEAIADFAECEAAQTLVRSAPFAARLEALRATVLVDYPGVAAAKLAALELLHAHFARRHLARESTRAKAFAELRARKGEALHRHALFEALQEHFQRTDPAVWGWPVWPAAYRDPASAEVARFAVEQRTRVEFFEYLQWQADEQLAAAAHRARTLGLGVGLYADLAVSVDRAGAESWANQALYAIEANIGAPPDDFSPQGQDWGLPPLVPERLRAAAYAPFIATLRANMRHAGALRIDHVMGLLRLFWVPPGSTPADGTYVRYPLDDLLGILALESHRNRCLVVGEDLGTVPDEVRAALAAHGVLSYKVLLFERDGAGEFKPPAVYAAASLVTASTHDLPTLAGWWSGHDLTLRAELGLISDGPARDQAQAARTRDRAALARALAAARLAPPDASTAAEVTPALACAVQRFLARSPAQVLVVQLEDVLGVQDQANPPGAAGERHPNWRRKLPLALEGWGDDARFVALAAALAAERPQRARRTSSGAIVPRATYRLQLHRDFGFAQATELVPYLSALGISHVYCSPYLRARPGSRHGYDIVDHGALNPEIGSDADFERFCATLARHGMGQILDMVPNHMAILGADNAWWMDVLENGPASAYADWFDIDWSPLDPELAGKVLVPVLGGHYGVVLEGGELVLEYEAQAGSFAVRYHEHRFPLDPREYPTVLERAASGVDPGGVDADARSAFQRLIEAFRQLPPRILTAPAAVAERAREKEAHKAALAQLVRSHPALSAAIERAVRRFNGSAGKSASFDLLDALIDTQAYRLAYWRVAADEINYRRFFDINDLAALRMENDAAFEATHRFVLGLAATGRVDGLRIDHPDGLHDPAHYFRRLQERYAERAGIARAALDAVRPRPLYVVAEKIIAPHEQVPESWPVHGTTGYRFANVVNGILVDTAARSRVDRAWRAFVREEALDYDEAIYRSKRAILRGALAGQLTVAANRLLALARATRHTRDYTANALRQALAEVVACFPVYRTYLAERATPQDRRYVDWAIGRAKRRSLAADASIFDFVRAALLAQPPADASATLVAAYRAFAMGFQQLTAPVSAKGVEDTSFYVFNRLISLNDVGGDPDHFGMTLAAFHGAAADRAAKWPHTMLATSTHDNKRSEDVRTRIDVISELPALWRLAVRRWSRMNRSKRRMLRRRPAPSRNDEYLLYQTLVGSFPAGALDAAALAAYRERIQAFMLKAVREAKVHTSWITPDAEYEAAVSGFVEALLARVDGDLFMDDFRAQLPTFAWFGLLNSISMTLLKLTSPGVPDLYQGNELLDFSLVDPDNRRPVDYAVRRAALDTLQEIAIGPAATLRDRLRALFAIPHAGRAKLWVIMRALQLRREQPDLFANGDYYPITLEGARSYHAVAYARRLGSRGIVAIVGRLFTTLGPAIGVAPLGASAWGDTTASLAFLPAGTALANVLTGETVTTEGGALPLARAFAHFPGALLAYDAAALR